MLNLLVCFGPDVPTVVSKAKRVLALLEKLPFAGKSGHVNLENRAKSVLGVQKCLGKRWFSRKNQISPLPHPGAFGGRLGLKREALYLAAAPLRDRRTARLRRTYRKAAGK